MNIDLSREAWNRHQSEIRRRAYFLWLDMGKPVDQDRVMWALAEYALRQEALARSDPTPA